MKESALNINL